MLDCQTSKGKKYISDQNQVQNFLESLGYEVTTDEDDYPIDFMLFKNEKLTSIAEIKSRDFLCVKKKTLLNLKFLREEKYLITYDKLKK